MEWYPPNEEIRYNVCRRIEDLIYFTNFYISQPVLILKSDNEELPWPFPVKDFETSSSLENFTYCRLIENRIVSPITRAAEDQHITVCIENTVILFNLFIRIYEIIYSSNNYNEKIKKDDFLTVVDSISGLGWQLSEESILDKVLEIENNYSQGIGKISTQMILQTLGIPVIERY